MLGGDGEDAGSGVAGEDALDVVVGRAVGAEVVEPDLVGLPLPGVDVGHERGVGGHLHDVSVALEAGHEGGFGDGGEPVVFVVGAGRLDGLGGVFAGEDLGAGAVVFVVAVGVGEEPVGAHVVVFVDDVGVEGAPGGPHAVEGLSGWERAGGDDELDLRMLGLERGGEDLVAIDVAGAPLLVADADHGEMEGLGMAHLGAELAPGRGDGAVGEFDEVEGVADVFVELGERGGFAGVELAGHAAVEDGQGFGADVFGELEVFVEAEAEGLEVVGRRAGVELVVPAIDDGLSFGDVADGGLPAIAGDELAALDDAASGEAEEAGVHVVEQLDEVFAEAVGAAFPGVDGEERDHVEIELAGRVNDEIQARVLVGGVGADGGFVFLPFVVEAFELCRFRGLCLWRR